MTIDQLHSIRLRVHLALVVALLASVAANVLAAEPTVVARAVAAWPPVALMLVVDVLGRAPTGSGWIGRVAVAAAGVVAFVAGLASFAHVRAVALAVGESDLVAWVLPLSVDGLAVVCSVALVEISGRLNGLDDDAHAVSFEPSLNERPPLVLFNSSPPDSGS